MWVAVKPVAPVLDVDWLAGTVRTDQRHLVRSPADAAACAVAASVAGHLGVAYGVVAVGGPAVTEVLRTAVAEGASSAVRLAVGEDRDDVSLGSQWPSAVVAAALAEVVAGAAIVVCGDASLDRGSGTVPGLLAGVLGVAQVLGARTVEVEGTTLVATRRLDGGRRERVRVAAPCVLSVEAGAGAPERAALEEVLASVSPGAPVEVRLVTAPPGAARGDAPGTRVGPYRARPSDLAPPVATDPVRRAIEVAGTLQRRDAPEVLRAEPEQAATTILDRLARWGLR